MPYKLILYIIACALSVVQMGVYIHFKIKGKGFAYTLSKCTGSLIFILTAVMAAIIGLTDKGAGVIVDAYTWLIIGALILSAGGDFFLAQSAQHRLFIGACLFALSHVTFITAYIVLAGFHWQVIPIIAGLFLFEVLMAWIIKLNCRGVAVQMGVYIFTVTSMACFAFTLLFSQAVSITAAAMTAFGGALFLISDVLWLMYGLDKYSPKKLYKILNVVTYFPAQMLIAGALLLR